MRSKNAMLNIAFSLVVQLLTAISGLIVSRLILQTFGSNVNGLVASITQFLSYVSLLEAGVGGVIRAALFKPLADNDNEQISGIVKATRVFFSKIAIAFGFYVVILAIAYPYTVKGTFSWEYVSSLILIISLSTFFEYFFCLPYINLLSADQKVWIISILNSLLLVINIVVLYLAISVGLGIHGVKICGFVVYIIKPVFYALYVRKHYKIQKVSNKYVIKQKWNGIIHNLAQFVHNNTDIVLISLLINVSEVSVYAVYYAVASGIERITTSISIGCAAGIGDVIARDEKEQLYNITNQFEFIQSGIATILFSTTGVLIVPFIQLFTAGVTDTDYIRPVFAYILVLAELFFCIRSIYSTIILNAGHYRETQINAIAEAAINIVVSLSLISRLGIIGVAIGTLTGMLARTLLDVRYLSRNIVYRSPALFLKCLGVNGLVFITTSVICNLIPLAITSWLSWIISAVIVFSITVIIALIIYIIFYKSLLMSVIQRIKNVFF